jgi:hypothetical protein
MSLAPAASAPPSSGGRAAPIGGRPRHRTGPVTIPIYGAGADTDATPDSGSSPVTRSVGAMLTEEELTAIHTAVKAGKSPGLGPPPYRNLIQAIGAFLGGPPESVDAFVAGVDAYKALDAYNVIWLRGNSIGLLSATPGDSNTDPLELAGWVRPVSKIRQIEIRGVQFYDQDVWPKVRIHFDDELDTIVEVSAADALTKTAREQALNFIKRITAAIEQA